MDERKVINVPKDELGIKRAYNGAVKAKSEGKSLAFDLRHIEDRKTKAKFIMMMNEL